MSTHFPNGFYWGTATASFQIEGATQEGGRGESIWDRFAAMPNAILTGETGDPACDSYHRYPADIAIMKEPGVNAYRFSTAWPRIIPDGDAAVNEKGLDYYDRLTDALLDEGIQPFVTLYHWDLPQALQDKGGWGRRATVDAFVRYADMTVARLGDRVKHWITHNEPWCVSILSHELGQHAPGLRDRRLALQVAHHVLLSHGEAVPVIRDRCKDGVVGITLNFEPGYPATDSDADRDLSALHNARFNRWFLEPVAGKGYPEPAWSDYGADVPHIEPGDMERIAQPLDFLGVNYYTCKLFHDPAGSCGAAVINRRNPQHMMSRGWEIYPQALADLLLWIHRAFAFPALYVTENGAMYDDVVYEGEVHDPARIAYIKAHVSVMPDLIGQGVPLKGYFCWNLMDNFEWASGTGDKFGLAHTNFETQERFLKDSGKWFARITRANAVVD